MAATTPKTWAYRGCVIEEDFESWADRAPQIFLKSRTGYVIRADNWTAENEGPYVPGKYRTLAEAKRGVDEELKEGGVVVRVSTEDGMTWYEDGGKRACVSRNGSGYMVHSHWTRDGKNWVGGYGEGTPITLEEATDLAKRFVSGQPVPEELGGYEDNKPVEVT